MNLKVKFYIATFEMTLPMTSKIFAQLFDRTYKIFTNDLKCSLKLEPDHFDGRQYSVDEFFELSCSYFDQPEQFYRLFNFPTPDELKQAGGEEKMRYKNFLFPSPVTTEWTENNTAHFRLISNDQISDVLLLFAPGWGRSNLNAETEFCSRFLDKGIDTCLLIKPFHQQRTPKGFFSGELFISHNVFLTVKNFQQFVAEIRFLLQHFRTKYKYVGLIGLSSGGFQSGLALDTEYADFYFPVITGARLGSIAWNGTLSVFLREQVSQKGLTESDLNKVGAVADQYYIGHNCQAKYIKQFLSLYDEVVPTENQYLLWEIYKKPELTKMHCAYVSIYFYINRLL